MVHVRCSYSRAPHTERRSSVTLARYPAEHVQSNCFCLCVESLRKIFIDHILSNVNSCSSESVVGSVRGCPVCRHESGNGDLVPTGFTPMTSARLTCTMYTCRLDTTLPMSL